MERIGCKISIVFKNSRSSPGSLLNNRAGKTVLQEQYASLSKKVALGGLFRQTEKSLREISFVGTRFLYSLRPPWPIRTPMRASRRRAAGGAASRHGFRVPFHLPATFSYSALFFAGIGDILLSETASGIGTAFERKREYTHVYSSHLSNRRFLFRQNS